MTNVWSPDAITTLVFGVVGVIIAVLGFRFRGSICHGFSRLLQSGRGRRGTTTADSDLASTDFAMG